MPELNSNPRVIIHKSKQIIRQEVAMKDTSVGFVLMTGFTYFAQADDQFYPISGNFTLI